jgi:hypothetical protein
MKLLIGTEAGLLFWKDGESANILPGKVYGITKDKENWYCYHSQDNSHGIVKLSFKDDRLVETETIIKCVRGVHQIDFIDKELVITDTSRNQLLIYPSLNARPRHIVPNGCQQQIPVPDETHLHLNSIYSYKDVIYVMVHNLSVRFNRPSELLELHPKDYSVRAQTKLDGWACHNIYVDEEGILFLDSYRGRIMKGEKTLVEVEPFLRGLAVTDDYYVVGTNLRAPPPERDSGGLLVFDRKFNKKAEYDLATQVFEVRCFDSPDYAMSNTPR